MKQSIRRLTSTVVSSTLFAWFINHQPTVLFSQTKPATNNQLAVLFYQNKSASTTSNHTNMLVTSLPQL
jgi:hypothetical protein